MTSTEGLPIPDYDQVLMRDIEQRLQGLDAEAVGRLLEHERGYAARPDTIALLEQRRALLREHPPAKAGPPSPAPPRR